MPHLSVMRAYAWILTLYGLITLVPAGKAFYVAAASGAQRSNAELLGALLVGHVVVFTLLKMTIGVRRFDENLRLLRTDNTVANRLGSGYRLLVVLVYCAIGVFLVLVFVPQLRIFSATPRVGLLFLTASLTALSLLFIACGIVGPRSILRPPADRPPLLYKLSHSRFFKSRIRR